MRCGRDGCNSPNRGSLCSERKRDTCDSSALLRHNIFGWRHIVGEMGEDTAGDAESDETVLAASVGDPERFAVFYRRHARAVLRFFATRTFDPEAAADLTAETFAEAFVCRSRWRAKGKAAAWLYGIARHELSRYVRRGQAERRARERLGFTPIAVEPDDFRRIEDLVDFEAVGLAVGSALRGLPEGQREALSLRVVEGRPYPEVAHLLACSEEVVRARVSRGLRRLAATLEAIEVMR